MGSSLGQFSPTQIAETINKAETSICMVSPGLSIEMANALCEVVDRNPRLSVKLLLDVSPEVCRLGYGFHEAVKLLQRRGITPLHKKGIRLMILVVDGSGWMVAPQPLLVESFDEASFVNSMALTPIQIDELYGQFFTELTPISTKPVEGAGPSETVELDDSLPVNKDHIDMVEKSLDQNKPQEFDLARKVMVFNSFVEFVELELTGASLNRRRLRLPKILMDLLADDEELKGRLTGAYRLLGQENQLSSTELESKIKRIRETYLPSLGRLGRVILRSNRSVFEKELEEFRQMVEAFKSQLANLLTGKIEKSLEDLVVAISPRILMNPPPKLVAGIGGSVDQEKAEKFVRAALKEEIPDINSLINGVELNVVFKSVTYEMLTDLEFQDSMKNAFPYIDWDKPLDEFETLLPKLK